MIRAYHQPENLDAALELVARGAVPVAGATALFTSRSSRDAELVDLTRAGIDAIRVEPARLVLGAMVTLSTLADADSIPGMAGALLRRVARHVASPPLRNAITIGGNIAHPTYWADLPPVLVALDAALEIRRAGQAAQWVPIASCLEAKKRPWDGGLITSVAVPITDRIQGFGHERFVRTVTDYSLATVCATATRSGSILSQVSVVVGAVQMRPQRVADIERKLEGMAPGADAIGEAAKRLSEQVAIAPNFRASAQYRRDLVAVLTRRALTTACSWAMREN
jgi:aerobic carbon-monoxide dehydrogenase medium subunit